MDMETSDELLINLPYTGDTICGKPVTATWIDEHFLELARPIDDVIADTVREYYNQWKDSDRIIDKDRIRMMWWVRIWLGIKEDTEDELL